MDKPGLYIHIPFCNGKCPYCDFYSEKPYASSEEEYCLALADELEKHSRVRDYCDGGVYSPDTVYFGGGTPSLLSKDSFDVIFNSLKRGFNVADDAEITVECNPSCDVSELFPELSALGVNRLSIGLQTACDGERRLLGRRSGAERVREVVRYSKECGIRNISLDVMLGIPSQTMKTLGSTLEFCAECGASHVSAYMLKLEPGTVFYDRQSTLSLPEEDTVCDMYEYTVEKLGALGYPQYEISNFARPGSESRHNLKYWQLVPYLGIGPAAHSFVGGKRFYFPRSITDFINGSPPVFDGIGGDVSEYIMLSLRLNSGIALDEMKELYGAEKTEELKKKALPFIKQCLVKNENNRIALTTRGFLVSNSIIAELT